MGRNLDPKCKQCRREGTKLFLKGERCFSAKCALVKRNYVPGIHGPKARRTRLSGYGVQLREKQKAKRMYGLLEKQFSSYYKKAFVSTGDTGKLLCQFLETRFDNVVYRLGLASSRNQARQLIGQGHFQINGKKATIPSMHLKISDIISVKAKSNKSPLFEKIFKSLASVTPPSWLFLDNEKSEGKVVGNFLDSEEDLNLGFNVKLIVEYYSK